MKTMVIDFAIGAACAIIVGAASLAVTMWWILPNAGY